MGRTLYRRIFLIYRGAYLIRYFAGNDMLRKGLFRLFALICKKVLTIQKMWCKIQGNKKLSEKAGAV